MSLAGTSPLAGLAPLGGRRFPRLLNLILFPSVPSTNDVARRIVEKAFDEDAEFGPTAVVTRDQTAGRGRAGRGWTTIPGKGLAVSLVLPWPEGPGRVRVPAETGIALARGLSRCYGLDVRLKWPNDLLVRKRKLGGLLVEARTGEDGVGYAVVGIGLNVTATREELDAAGLSGATSLLLEGVDPAHLAADEPLAALLSVVDESLGGPPDDLAAAFESVSAHAPGELLVVRDGAKTVQGTYLGVTADGFLRLDTGGRTETILSGDLAEF